MEKDLRIGLKGNIMMVNGKMDSRMGLENKFMKIRKSILVSLRMGCRKDMVNIKALITFLMWVRGPTESKVD